MRTFAIVAVLLIAIAGAGIFVYKDFKTEAAAESNYPPSNEQISFVPSSSAPPGGGFPQGGPGGGGQGRGGRMLARLTTELSLTPTEVDKIKPILADQREKMTEIRNDSSLTDDQRASEMKQARDAEEQQIKPILTADQFTKYQAFQAQARMRFGGGPGGPGGFGGPSGPGGPGGWGGGSPGGNGGRGGNGGPGGPGGNGGAGGAWGGIGQVD